MKKLMYLTALCLAATLLSAPAALAQEAGPGGEDRCTGTPFENYIPEVNGCVTTEGQPFPGEVTVFDADTREPIGTLAEVTESIEGENGGTGAQPPTATEGQQYAPPTTTATTTPTATEQYTPPTTTATTTTPTATTTTAPTTTTATDLPDTGGISLLLPAAALLLASGLVGLKMSRRP